MSKIIDFYFDFISPYSYIAYKKIKSMQNKNGVDFNYKPILLGGLHKLGNITAPAFNERKMKNMKNDCEIIANKNNISFKWNEKFPINTLYLMRGFISIDANNQVTTNGLKYNLNNEALRSSSQGLSNLVTEDNFSIESAKPILLFRKLL